MALKATVYRAELAVADIDRGYYATHSLTLARHPSETEERLMIRLLAFALYADERLTFGRGLSSDDEPDLWRKEDNGEISRWIDVGLPDERRLRRAAGRARALSLLVYGQRAAEVWWRKNQDALARLSTLTVLQLADDAVERLARLAARNMTLQATLQDGQISLSDAGSYVVIEPARLM
jgi:uncharacterized protein YaeQ